MILNSDSIYNELDKVLIEIYNSDHGFALTGSRFFGNHNDNSDYDFFANYEKKVIDFLERLGFKQITVDTYRDSQIVRIYRRHFESQGDIDIMLVHSFRIKAQAQHILSTLQLDWNSVKKCAPSTMTQLWESAYRLAACSQKTFF